VQRPQSFAMRISIFAAWALAMTASSAHAFLPVPSAAPALISLRHAGPLASRFHSVGCACGSWCGPTVGRAQRDKLSLRMQEVGDERIFGEASKLSADSATYCHSLEELFPGVSCHA